jgi:hypothetical protein
MPVSFYNYRVWQSDVPGRNAGAARTARDRSGQRRVEVLAFELNSIFPHASVQLR